MDAVDGPRDDSVEEIALGGEHVPNPEFASPEVLRRAFRLGKRSREEFDLWSFAEVEAELRRAWMLNGETAEWAEVRDSVRLGFETGGDSGIFESGL
ncbi:hypothetical protein [Gemmata sp.]|uniref:hypothetical protein n=1 Tax=Gemmata sp. TaxID=1914242 RepID=UPI003F6F1467